MVGVRACWNDMERLHRRLFIRRSNCPLIHFTHSLTHTHSDWQEQLTPFLHSDSTIMKTRHGQSIAAVQAPSPPGFRKSIDGLWSLTILSSCRSVCQWERDTGCDRVASWMTPYFIYTEYIKHELFPWMGSGSRCQAHRLECVKNCNASGFLRLTVSHVSRMVHHPANLTQLWEALESTWTGIPVERFPHLVESMPGWIEAVLRTKGDGATQY
jgi:hypothetical protein